jgi:hypothetical protein
LRSTQPTNHGSLSGVALPARPPGLREKLTGQRDLEIARVELLPKKLTTRRTDT